MISAPFSLDDADWPIPPARQWDVVLTCFEPLVAVTGGIGTYHRLLIRKLSDMGLSVLVLARSLDMDELPGVTVLDVTGFQPERAFNFVGLEHQQFSLHCHFAFHALYRAGHRFRFVEFSDYGNDGFYPLRARASGAYELGVAAVRLHSPEVMLIEDNGGNHAALSVFKRDVIDREMSVYDDADMILYGGDAMRDRVLALTRKFGLDVAHKVVKCPHPYPRHLFDAAGEDAEGMGDRAFTIARIAEASHFAQPAALEDAQFIGIVGRIEDRKGQYQLLSALLKDDDFVRWMRGSNVHFVIAGHNVLDHLGNYRVNDLYELIHSRALQARFHFLGRVAQDDLARISRAMLGHVFPSIFENYPNALLEVLPECRPVAVSVHGCMPEIVEGFSRVHVFDPKRLDTRAFIDILESMRRDPLDDVEAERARRIAKFEALQAEIRQFFTTLPAPAPRAGYSAGAVTVVIPVYQSYQFLAETLASLNAARMPGDAVIVVDDGSSAENSAAIAQIAQEAGAKFLRMAQNVGPGEARLAGVKAAQTPLIQLCDADDLIPTDGMTRLRTMFDRDADLDMATGTMSCFGEADHCWVPRNGQFWTAIQDNFSHSGTMWRRDSLLKALDVNHPRLHVNEDWLMNLMMIAVGGKCRMTPEITYQYRRYGGTRSAVNQSLAEATHRIVMTLVAEALTFTNKETESRARMIIGASLLSPLDPRALVASAFDRPFRYRLADLLYFRLQKRKMFMRVMSRIKRAAVARGIA